MHRWAVALVTVAVLLGIWLALPARDTSPPPVIMGRAQFDAAIEALALRDAPSSDGMWHDPTLRALAGMGSASVDDALAFLDCGCRSLAEAGVTVRAMYLLPLRDYLRFLDGIAKLYDRNAIGPDVVALSVQVPDAFSTELQRHFDDPAVRSTLNVIAARGTLPQGTKDSIGDLLAGRTWAQTRAFCRGRMFESVGDCRTLGWLDLL